MSRKEYTGKIPFDKDGLINYVGLYDEDVIWEDNYTFDTTLKFDHFIKGRSAFKVVFIDTNDNQTYYMFLKDFTDIINKMCNGVISGTWTFVKRGSNYGIKSVNN